MRSSQAARSGRLGWVRLAGEGSGERGLLLDGGSSRGLPVSSESLGGVGGDDSLGVAWIVPGAVPGLTGVLLPGAAASPLEGVSAGLDGVTGVSGSAVPAGAWDGAADDDGP